MLHARRFRFGDDGQVRVYGEERISATTRIIKPIGACDHKGVALVQIPLRLIMDRTVDGEDVGVEFVASAFEEVVTRTGGEVTCVRQRCC